MAAISVSELRPGMRLAYDVLDSNGRLLLAARVPLTEETLHALRSRPGATLTIRSADHLPAHVRASAGGAWLMADHTTGDEQREAISGEEAPSEALVRDETGPEEVGQLIHAETHPGSRARSREAARVRAALRRAAEDVVVFRSPRWGRLELRVEPKHMDHAEFMPSAGSVIGSDSWREERGSRVTLVRRMIARLADGMGVSAAGPITLVEELVADGAPRPDALVRSALLAAGETDEPASHAFGVAEVSVAIATWLGWARKDRLAAGLTGLLCDCGLELLAMDIRVQPRQLTEIEANAMQRHTGHSAALLELVRTTNSGRSIPEQVQLSIYQHHEREDGSGYPNRLRGGQIHDLARVVGVADVLVGLASNRAHRPAMDAGAALEEVARQANRGALHPHAARAVAAMLIGPAQTDFRVVTGASRFGARKAA